MCPDVKCAKFLSRLTSALRCPLLPSSVALQELQSLASVPIGHRLTLHHLQQAISPFPMTSLTTMTIHLPSTGAHVLNVLAHLLHLLTAMETKRTYPHCVLIVLKSLHGLSGGLVRSLSPQHGLECVCSFSFVLYII